ncbi:MAG: hypothetical protein R2705_01055 [Ilumatobacteraceae bacterium]
MAEMGTPGNGAAFCSVEEAARFLGIGRSLAYKEANKYLDTGKADVPARRFGNRILVPIAVLQRMANGEQP